MGKPRGPAPQTKINVTSKSPVGDISVVTLIRTDTTLDHSQKAEKVCHTQLRGKTSRSKQQSPRYVIKFAQSHSAPRHWGPRNKQKDWSRAAYPPQRSLRAALGCYPTTAGGAQFCLLCCQPGPVPESLPARPPTLTHGRPCRPPVWLGHPIHTASRTCHGPQRFISQVPMRGTGRHDPPQREKKVCVASQAIVAQ